MKGILSFVLFSVIILADTLSIENIFLEKQPDMPKTDNYALYVIFNRSLKKSEIETTAYKQEQYGYKYRIYADNGWDSGEMYRIYKVKEMFLDQSLRKLWLTSEADHHPLRGYNQIVDEAFSPERITKVVVELYQRKNNLYKNIERKIFNFNHKK